IPRLSRRAIDSISTLKKRSTVPFCAANYRNRLASSSVSLLGKGGEILFPRHESVQENRSSLDAVFRDYQSHYFRGSFADRVEPRLSPVPVPIALDCISISSVYLARICAASPSML